MAKLTEVISALVEQDKAEDSKIAGALLLMLPECKSRGLPVRKFCVR